MGSHPMAVVDDESRVQGLEDLRDMGGSVMPAATSNAPTIMIAEKGRRSSSVPRGKDWRRNEGRWS
jgi:choline dehydrogenase-like flavoprotein